MSIDLANTSITELSDGRYGVTLNNGDLALFESKREAEEFVVQQTTVVHPGRPKQIRVHQP